MQMELISFELFYSYSSGLEYAFQRVIKRIRNIYEEINKEMKL